MIMNEFATENNLLSSALALASLGYRVFPCHSVINGCCTCGGKQKCKPGKHPLTQHGFKDATTDEATIRSWWSQYPYANVAIATGERVWVLDEDLCHGGDKTLAALIAEHGALPNTPTVRTGGGGRQFYFRYPEGATIRSRSPVAVGIDVRGDGGYVVAPPSIHLSGRLYEWEADLDTPLADAPAWLVEIVADRPATKPVAVMQRLVMGSSEPHDFANHAGAGEGQRNSTLCRLIGVHLSRGDSPSTIEC